MEKNENRESKLLAALITLSVVLVVIFICDKSKKLSQDKIQSQQFQNVLEIQKINTELEESKLRYREREIQMEKDKEVQLKALELGYNKINDVLLKNSQK